MSSITETPRGERIAGIIMLLIRNRRRKYSVTDIYDYLNQSEPVILRNVQRDLKMLADRHEEVIGVERREGKLWYFIQPDMRDKLSLPIERNGLLALFLLKRLQSFFSPETKSLKQLSEVVAELSSHEDYDLFEDLDERLADSTYLFGEHSSLCLDGPLFNDLLTTLVQHRKLDITYRRPEGKDDVKRTICPVKLILFKGELFFICMSELHADRDYYIKLCRIVTAQITENLFTVPKDRLKRIEKRLSTSFGILDADVPEPEEVSIRFPSYFDLILSERRFHSSQKLSSDKKGNVILRMTVPVDTELIQWVLGWSDKARVLKPKKLKDDLKAMGNYLIKAYGGQ
jgi:proteasome accessory factor B